MKKVFIFGVSVASLGAASLLLWFYSKANSKKKRLEIQIPNSVMGYMIGRGGGTLKNIQMKSQAKIHFLAPEGSSHYSRCVIKGDKNSVQLAAGIINDFVDKFNDEDKKSSHSDEFEFQVSDEKLVKDVSNIVEEILGRHWNHHKNDPDEVLPIKTENVDDFVRQHTQKLYSPGGDGLVPVYVSAVFSPDKFWIQLIKTKEHADLDRLTEKMFDYYNSDVSLNVPPPLDDIKNGYLCAVFYEADNRWYRAQVYEIISNNDENIFLSTVDLYLLDFGESIYEKVANLRPMPPEFLNLNFQAIECSLSNIKATGGNWTEEAILYFEDIIHVGQWYTLMARIDFHEEGYRPYLTLIDNNGEMSTNIAEALVAYGFGKTLN